MGPNPYTVTVVMVAITLAACILFAPTFSQGLLVGYIISSAIISMLLLAKHNSCKKGEK